MSSVPIGNNLQNAIQPFLQKMTSTIDTSDRQFWTLLGTALTGGFLTYKVFLPTSLRELRSDNFQLQQKIDQLTNQVGELQFENSDLNRQLNVKTHEFLLLNRENETLSEEIKSSGRGDLFLLYTEVKNQLTTALAQNSSLKHEVSYLRPLSLEISQERERSSQLDKELNFKIRDNSKLAGEISNLNRKLRNLKKENDRLLSDYKNERNRNNSVFTDKESASDSVLGTSVTSTTINYAESVASTRRSSKDTIPEAAPKSPTVNSTSPAPPVVNITNITNTTATSTSAQPSRIPKRDYNKPMSQQLPKLSLELHYSSDQTSKEQMEQLKAKLKSKFGLKINMKFKEMDEDDAFELYISEKLIFSKFEAGCYPDLNRMVGAVEKVHRAATLAEREKIVSQMATGDGCVIS